MRSRTCLLTALALTASLGATASTAGAATLTAEGDDLVLRAAPGEQNSVSLWKGSFDETKLSIGPGYGNTLTTIPAGCDDHRDNGNFVECPRPAGAVRYELGDGADAYSTSSDLWPETVVVVDGGDGADDLRGFGARETLIGGTGNDKLSGWTNADVLDGGEGDDTLEGGEGADRLSGGNGNDMLAPDGYEQQSSDVVDGGAGVDTIEGDYSSRWVDADPPVSLTLGGGADDGRPGENDDIQGVERVTLSDPGGRIVGTDAPEYMKLHQVGQPGVLIGHGGDDELRGGDGEDTIDGGTGNDRIDGGFGDDAITGGPGRDTITADQTTGECSYLWCKHPFGNDTVNVRDGEADSVSCGTGTDKVVADAVDTVAPDCEQVDRAAAATPAPGPGVKGAPKAKVAGPGVATSSNPRVKLGTSQLKLATVLRSGLKLTIKGARRGTKARALDGRKRVGSGRVKAGGKVTIRFTKQARRTLARKRTVRLTVVAGSVRSTVTLAR